MKTECVTYIYNILRHFLFMLNKISFIRCTIIVIVVVVLERSIERSIEYICFE